MCFVSDFLVFQKRRRALSLVSVFLLASIHGGAIELITCQPAEAKFGRKGKNTQSSADKYYDVGISKMRADDLDGAIDSFSQSLYFARNGYNPKANYWLGICYLNKADYKKAEEYLLRATEQTVENMPEAWLAIAEVRIKTDQPELKFRDALQKARLAKADRHQVSYMYGIYSDSKGKYMNAMSHYMQALGDKPWKWTKVWMKYAECKMKLQKWAEAIREFNAILTTDEPLKEEPLGRIHHDIGVCKLALGDHQGAIDHWMRALDYDRTNREVWLQLGMLYEAEKHYSSAIRDYKEFLRLTPTGSGEARVEHVRSRIIQIEHMLTPNETVPQPAKPSPYMRRQVEGVMQEQNRQQQVQQREKQIQQDIDSGF